MTEFIPKGQDSLGGDVCRKTVSWKCKGSYERPCGGFSPLMNTSQTSSTSWEHTQIPRRKGIRPDFTLKGMNNLEGGCSVETGFMEVPWKGSGVRPMNGSYQYRRQVDADGVNPPVLLPTQLEKVNNGAGLPIGQLDPTEADWTMDECKIFVWTTWIRVVTWTREWLRLKETCSTLLEGDDTWLVHEWTCDQMDQLGLSSWAVGPGLDSGRAMWVTRVCRWAGWLLGLSHELGQSVWACFGHVQEWFDSSRTSGNCKRRKAGIRVGKEAESFHVGNRSDPTLLQTMGRLTGGSHDVRQLMVEVVPELRQVDADGVNPPVLLPTQLEKVNNGVGLPIGQLDPTEGDDTWLVHEWTCDQMDQLGLSRCDTLENSMGRFPNV
ncbi:hypothetical protein Bca52824_041276 [Brassica carinata]|uniref:Uncharacterized protein n=1 Tax=Brassica carinata TaxID=52824 RepID=A0A8X7RV25_BRACI|nr:hypothetical protein Bca52824_041276 [Brassica carinata]